MLPFSPAFVYIVSGLDVYIHNRYIQPAESAYQVPRREEESKCRTTLPFYKEVGSKVI